MGDASPVLCVAVRKHLSYVLKWYKVLIERCSVCSKCFICAYKDPASEEVIVLPVSSSTSWSFKELASLRNCLPIIPSAPLTIAIVDPSSVITLYSVCDGLSEDLHHRTWRPTRSFLENPEKHIEAETRKVQRKRSRQRQDRSDPKFETAESSGKRRPPVHNTPDDVIVIDD